MWSAVIFVGLCILSCYGETPPGGDGAQQATLVNAEAWRPVDADEDPFSRERPAELNCESDGVVVEDGVLEIDTGRCPYITVKQQTLIPVGEGDGVSVTIYHDALYSEPASEGHLALFIEHELLWYTRVPIPSSSRLFSERFRMPRFFPAGSRIDFHLHNHGLNHWRLVSILTDEMTRE